MSLTKKQLLAELVCTKPEKLKEQVFGQEAWVKPVSEFQRSRRLAALYGKDGEVSRDAIRKARLYTIVDHLCDQDGENLFKESDIKDLMELDAFLDRLEDRAVFLCLYVECLPLLPELFYLLCQSLRRRFQQEFMGAALLLAKFLDRCLILHYDLDELLLLSQ